MIRWLRRRWAGVTDSGGHRDADHRPGIPAALKAELHPDDQRRAEAWLTHDPLWREMEYCELDRGPDLRTAAEGLTWGGVLWLAGSRAREVDAAVARVLQDPDLTLDQPTRSIPSAGRKSVRFGASVRRTGQHAAWQAARMTYQVDLVGWSGDGAIAGLAVRKQVPALESVAQRLQALDPALSARQAEATALGLVRKGMPLMLSREAAFLKILHRRLPAEVDAGDGRIDPRLVIPRVLDLTHDDAGLVQSFTMTWLRQGRPRPLALLDFVAGAARMTAALHRIGVLHLDLRLDNLVVTPDGVGVIDFGSSVRQGEDLSAHRIVGKTLGQALSASQLATELRDMQAARRVTAPLVLDSVGKATPEADVAALTLQMTRVDEHPVLSHLVHVDRDAADYRRLARLRRDILRPDGAASPILRTAHDLARAVTDAPADAA